MSSRELPAYNAVKRIV